MNVALLLLLALALPAFAREEADPAKPNIIFILADDLGYADLACYGSRYHETPHLDRLAAEGLQLTNGYTNGANCQPTRAALISGQYAARTGIYTVGNIDRFPWQTRPLRPVDNVTALPLGTTTVAQALQRAGYATGLFGKWHLGNGPQHHPSRRGFDEAIVAAGKHFHFETTPPTDYPEGTYLADFLTDRAEEFITRRHREGPFFLYLAHFGVHAPYQAKPELVARFRNKPASGGQRDPVYAAMIASVDESVGRLVALLDRLEIAGNTLVIFSSDNGGVGGYAGIGAPAAKGITDNAPLKGGKGSFHEGGIRVPYLFRWPGRIPHGSTSDSPILSIDLYPTLLELAGAPQPENHPLDGTSYAALLREPKSAFDRGDLFWHFPGYLGAGRNQWRTTPVSVIRSGDWKLIETLETQQAELYHLKADLGETTDLAAAEPEKTAELRKKLASWRETIRAPLPTPHTPRAKAGTRSNPAVK